ncbi:MAG: hypothetical protein HZA69_03590 [Gammaproteobacteria bacterium]|nr:hypothetical protein [Gammaproteobacteria bacterium]
MAVSAWPVLLLANPFSALPLTPSGEIPASGKILLTLQDGDYVLPNFSPGSRYLAFARVVLQGATELTEIQALDLKTLEMKMLLDAKAALEFAIYKSFVAGFTWKDATTLMAGISDGDVNGVNLLFDVAAGKLIGKKPFSLANDAPGREEVLTPELTAAFPSIPPPVLANALANGFKVGQKKYVVQKNYWKQDNHVWYLDTERKQISKLVDIPDAWIYSLRGAFASGNAIILLVAYGPDAWLARNAGGKLELLYRFPVKNYQQTGLRVMHARGDRVLFQISTGPDYEKRENLLFAYDKSGLRKIKETAPVYDADVDSDGKLLCLSQWKGDKRRLVVRELGIFR